MCAEIPAKRGDDIKEAVRYIKSFFILITITLHFSPSPSSTARVGI